MSDLDRTIIETPSAAPAAPPTLDALAGSPILAGPTPILAAALPVLSLAPHLRTPAEPQGFATLDTRLAELVREFERRARTAGAEPAQVERAAWALSALLDDLILNTPWGGHGRWAPKSLVASRWRQVDAGDRFYDGLRDLAALPAQNLELLRLMYICLLLGFEGRYRVRPDARPTRAEVMADLQGLIGRYLPPLASELSPHWRGVEAAPRRRGLVLPLWALGCAALVLAGLVYLGFRQQLGNAASGIDTTIAALPPPAPVRVARAAAPQPAPVPQLQLPANVPGTQTGARLTLNLHDIARFAPGSADLDAASRARIEGLVPLLEREPGLIRVIGHTDDTPIKNGRYASNDELSRARAESVARVLAPHLADPSRLVAEGRGAREPLVPNTDDAARARNRRIEIVLERRAAR